MTRTHPLVAASKSDRSTARLEARIPATLKDILEEAASLSGHPSVTAYIIQALQESAARTVREANHTRLAAAESTAFVQSLLAPAAPVPALQAAFARYRDQVR